MPAADQLSPYLALPASWSGPVAARLNRLQAEIAAASGPADIEASWRSALADAPGLWDRMDRQGLADMMEAALGAHAVAGLATSALSKTSRQISALSADPQALAVAFAPFAEAADRLAARRPIASVARTAEWAQVPAMLRQRAFFSAGVESASWLDRIRGLLEARLRLEREALANGKQAWRDRDSFIDDARRLADAAGLPLADDGHVGTLRDIRSLPRLSLIYEVQNAQAAEYARRKADLEPAALEAYPAFQLLRVESRRVERGMGFWGSRWRQAGGSAGWSGALRSPQMALKTSPIWQALGDLGPFGTPYPPFDWGSGMGVVDVSRAEAETAGLLRPGQPTPPGQQPPDLLDDLHASAPVSPEIADRMRGWFRGQVEISGGQARWTGGAPA